MADNRTTSTTGAPSVRSRDDRGLALLGVLLILSLVGSVSSAMWVSGQTTLLLARNHEAMAQAESAAEAGLNHGLDLTLTALAAWQGNGYPSPNTAISGLLQGPDAASGTTATDADNGSLASYGIPAPPARMAVNFATGVEYEVRLFDEDDLDRGLSLSTVEVATVSEDTNAFSDANNQIIVQSTGHTLSGSLVSMEASIGAGRSAALVSDGSIVLEDTVSVTGSGGHVHANGALTIAGGNSVTGDATSSGAYAAAGSPTIGGVSGGGRPSLHLPVVSALGLLPLADLVLKSDGMMRDQEGLLVCDGTATTCWDQNDSSDQGWSWAFNGGTGWALTYAASCSVVTVCHTPGSGFNPLSINVNAVPAHLGHGDGLPGGLVPGDPTKMFGGACELLDVSDPPPPPPSPGCSDASPRTYFSETAAQITESASQAPTTLTVSLIAQGSVTVSGDMTIVADRATVLFATDQDLQLSGTFQQTGAEAMIYVREQLAASGSVALLGQVVVEDAATISALVTATTLSNSVQITNNGTLPGGTFEVTGWRTLRRSSGMNTHTYQKASKTKTAKTKKGKTKKGKAKKAKKAKK